MSATPRPWRRGKFNHIVADTTAGLRLVAAVHTDGDWQADAALIVRAVNSHDELAAALELERLRTAALREALEEALPGLRDLVSQECDDTDVCNRDHRVLAQALTALASAKAEPS